jgi:hypothetical protein
MPKQTTSALALAVLAGGVVYGVLHTAALQIPEFIETDEPYPYWYSLSQTLLEAINTVVPGFTAGWLAQRLGALIGGLAGVTGATIALVLDDILWGALPVREFLVTLVGTAIAAAVSNSIAGLAGEYARAKQQAV